MDLSYYLKAYLMYFLILILPVIIWIVFYRKKWYGWACIAGLVAVVCSFWNMMCEYTLANMTIDEKPIIYLYPEQTQEVSVKLVNDNIITTSYPKYNEEWKVIANPDGSLKDVDTGRNLYALYWEGNNNIKLDSKEGFVVKGEDSIKFLEEKLAILGLNEREAEEFIVYWLPRLEANDYNFIHFTTQEEIEEIMPLEVNPKPDTMIRVYMEFKKVNKNYKCEEQILEKQERNGFTLVEWGGIEL